jgi:hypothetical protein
VIPETITGRNGFVSIYLKKKKEMTKFRARVAGCFYKPDLKYRRDKP